MVLGRLCYRSLRDIWLRIQFIDNKRVLWLIIMMNMPTINDETKPRELLERCGDVKVQKCQNQHTYQGKMFRNRLINCMTALLGTLINFGNDALLQCQPTSRHSTSYCVVVLLKCFFKILRPICFPTYLPQHNLYVTHVMQIFQLFTRQPTL